jgi:hypothetical protein
MAQAAALLLSITLVFTLGAPGTVYASKAGDMLRANQNWYNEQDRSFTLRTNEDMQGLALIVNAGNDDFAGKTITLSPGSGSTLMGLTLPPIGTERYPFAGIFDGGGNTISNLTITPDSNTYIGLFGKTTSASVIKNLTLNGGKLTVAEDRTAAPGSQIRYVGGIAGYAGGSIENCYSSLDIAVSSKLAIGDNSGIIRNVGGLAGYIAGNMTDCKNSGDISISSPSNISETQGYLIGEIGGLAGAQGDVTDPKTLPLTENCENTGDFIFNVTGSGGIDRFGQQLYSVSFAAGGIIGQASGIIRNCVNSGSINTSNDTAEKPEAGRGANRTGGIVGDLRGNTLETVNDLQNGNQSDRDPGIKYFKDNGGASAAPASYPGIAGVYDCRNTGDVVGLAMVGGIVGSAGTFADLEGCSNMADVKGCRWNKPFSGGIGGTVQGNIRYCYSRGDVYSVTGGGYYCAGITGGLWSTNDAFTAENDVIPVVEMVGCYAAGTIYTDSPGYRTGIFAGENDGYIHDNVYSMTSMDSAEVDSDQGTVTNNRALTVEDLKASKGIGLLNTYAAGAGNWSIFYLPDGLDGHAANGGYPVLSRKRNTGGLDIQSQAEGAVPQVTRGAVYSVTMDPVPLISVGTLIQNADYYVVPQSGTEGNAPGDATYQATVRGMGRYTGALSATVPYKIIRAKISDCTIIAASAIFNWAPQKPQWVRLVDAAGNEVDPLEYTWRTTPEKKDGNGKYYDYTNCHGDVYKYDIEVTAKPTSIYYEGTEAQAVFRIGAKSLARMGEAGSPESAVKYGNVAWNGKEWDFQTALDDTSGNTIQITYTGKPITPTIKNGDITYMGRKLRVQQPDWYNDPTNYDYLYIYGNPNPEESHMESTDPINVTPAGKPSCMTVRHLSTGNFRNYINVFFRIVPANISAVSAAAIGGKTYTGKALTPDVKLTYNGKTLKKGTDYTLAYRDNIAAGRASVTIAGKGNYAGTKTVYFKINPAKHRVKKLTPGKGQLTVSFAKPVAAQKATGIELRYRVKGTSKWKTVSVSAKKSSYVIKKLKKGRQYQVQTRVVRKITSGGAKGSYYGAWSAAVTSKAIK